MDFCFSQHRNPESSRLVFRGEEKASFEVSTEGDKDKKEKTTGFEKIKFDPSLKTAKEHWDKIDEAYGKDAYTDVILSYVQKILPDGPADYRMALAMDSVDRYKKFYIKAEQVFMKTQASLESRFNYTVDRIVEQTQSDLATLRSGVERSGKFNTFNESMPSIENREAVKDHFENYLEALKGRYFNADVNEGMVIPGSGIPIIDPLLHPDKKALGDPLHPEERVNVPLFGPILGSDVFKGKAYEAKARQLHTGIKNWAMDRLDWLLSRKGTTRKDLETFKKEIAARYESYAKIDKNSSIISGRDLEAMEYLAMSPPDAIGRILDGEESTVIKRLEVMQVMNPEGWEETIEMAGNVVIGAARNNGAEAQFVATMKKYKRDVRNFSDARSEFKDMLEEKSKIGVRETLDFIRDFNQDVHGDVLQYEENIKPPAFQMMVHKQMDYLLGGTLVPHKETDRMLVRFMRADIKMKHKILDDPQSRDVLFRAIRLATDSGMYPKKYQDEYEPGVTRAKRLSRSPNIEKPTAHDRAAQLKALIILGEQAKVIVSKINKHPDYRGKDFTAEVESANVPDSDKVLKLGLRFKAPKGKAKFRSALDLGGFNTRDLALKGAKILGLLAVVSNVAQSFSETEGDFVDRIFQTGEKALTNHGVLAGAAVTVGAHMAERDPRLLRYPWLSQHERAGIMIGIKLDNIAARLGPDGHHELSLFTQNNAEWKALNHTNMTSDKIRQLLKEKAKRVKPGQKPYLTIADIGEVIQDKSITATMTRSPMSARTRYLFYQKFFAAPVKPDVNHVKELCTGSSHISTQSNTQRTWPSIRS